MSDLAHDLCVSDSHLHHLIRTGAGRHHRVHVCGRSQACGAFVPDRGVSLSDDPRCVTGALQRCTARARRDPRRTAR
jgi:hypothetical protein